MGLTLMAPFAWADFTGHARYLAVRQALIQKGVNATEIDRIFRSAENKPSILRAMNRPGEGKPWNEYRRLMVSKDRIAQGKVFMRTHKDALNRAEAQYGVPKSIILGILGIETGFGSNQGSFRTVDALSTLAFNYPRRADYFEGELIQHILWARGQGIDPLSTKSSYAGAMGYPQFMPTSVAKWAIDFDGNGHTDLSTPVDAIGSVANYLAQHGYTRNLPVAYPAKFTGVDAESVISTKPEIMRPLSFYTQRGLTTSHTVAPQVALSASQLDAGTDTWWLGTQNFNAIWQYNHSRKYVTAVWQLGDEIVK